VSGLCSTVCICCMHVCNACLLVQLVLTLALFFIPYGRAKFVRTLVFACRACSCMFRELVLGVVCG
jgi:hypothetical protein